MVLLSSARSEVSTSSQSLLSLPHPQWLWEGERLQMERFWEGMVRNLDFEISPTLICVKSESTRWSPSTVES